MYNVFIYRYREYVSDMKRNEWKKIETTIIVLSTHNMYKHAT